MKTPAVVIFSGHMRTFPRCIHSFRWHVARHYDVREIVVSTVEDEDSHTAEMVRELFPAAICTIDVRKEQPQLPEPVETVRFEPYFRSVSVQAVLRQLWQMEQAWLTFQDVYGDNSKAEVIIRARPDTFFHSFRPPGYLLESVCASPYWGRFGGINDRLGVMGVRAARSYFSTFSMIPLLLGYGCPLHPESLVMGALEQGGCESWTNLRTEFTTLRKDNKHRPPEIHSWDLFNG